KWRHLSRQPRPSTRPRSRLSQIRAPPLIRRVACEAFEHRGEMGLRLEADRQGHLHERYFSLLQQFLSTFDAPLHEIFMGPHAHRCAELRCKMHPAQACDCGKNLKRDLSVQMLIDILHDALEAPFLQRPYV